MSINFLYLKLLLGSLFGRAKPAAIRRGLPVETPQRVRTVPDYVPVVPLMVHRVALTQVNVPSTSPVNLYPVVGVWGDLTPLVNALGSPQSDDSLPVVLVTDVVLDAANPALCTLLLSQARTVNPADMDTDGVLPSVVDGPDGPALPVGETWTLQIPTAWLGMVHAVSDTPLQLRILLFDGFPPAYPETCMHQLTDATAVVLTTMKGVHEVLSTVMQPEWVHPMHVHRQSDDGDGLASSNTGRDLLWVTVAGLALGQDHAVNKALALADTVDHATRSPVPDAPSGPGVGVDVASQFVWVEDTELVPGLEVLVEVCEWALESSDAYELPRDEAGKVVWPTQLEPYRDKIDTTLNLATVDAFEEGHTFEDVMNVYGARDALFAFMMVLAGRALEAVKEPDIIEDGFRYTTSYLLGVWLDEDTETPWWATRATENLLMYHDTLVLKNLLDAAPIMDGEMAGQSVMMFRLLHVVTEALASLSITEDTFTRMANELDVKPSRFNDIMYVSSALMSHAGHAVMSERDECPGCYAVEQMVLETTDQKRLRATAAEMLPMLADVAASVENTVVGDPAWVQFRDLFLTQWLARTSFVPVEH